MRLPTDGNTTDVEDSVGEEPVTPVMDASRSRLVSCRCACQFSAASRALVLRLVSLGICDKQEIEYPSPSQESKEELQRQYSSLLTYMYVLSPSFVTGGKDHALQSHCEWEAIAASAIPILVLPSIHPIVDLYTGLPSLIFDSWTSPQLRPTWLRSVYEDLLVNLTRSTSVSKAYLPYWIGRFTEMLLTSKPPSRFFVGMEIALSRKPRLKCSLRQDLTPPLLNESFQNYSQPLARNLSPHSPANTCLLELVLPRCCEDGIELNWLESILAASPHVCVSLYYKCPSCLPESLGVRWAREVLAHEPDLRVRAPHGVRLVSDVWLRQYRSRVRQMLNLDLKYNGKEVTAYL
eukprot:gene10418-13371_t